MLRTAENLTPPSFQSSPQRFQQRVNMTPSERILVVEDDHAVQKALRRLFEAEGYAVQVAPTETLQWRASRQRLHQL